MLILRYNLYKKRINVWFVFFINHFLNYELITRHPSKVTRAFLIFVKKFQSTNYCIVFSLEWLIKSSVKNEREVWVEFVEGERRNLLHLNPYFPWMLEGLKLLHSLVVWIALSRSFSIFVCFVLCLWCFLGATYVTPGMVTTIMLYQSDHVAILI